MLSGDVLSRWLQTRTGTVVAGSLVRLSPSGLLRVSTVTDSHRVRVMLPVAHGGQAAVSRAVPEGRDGPSLALRVQAVSSEQEKARQMERLVAMLTVAEAAREDPATYPAVLPVHESFVVAVPATEIGTTGPTTEHELWCDVMAWCPRTLADHQRDAGPAGADPRTVAATLLPVMATVRAVHDNHNIVHRDITPNNVMVDEAGRLLLADWGIAHTVAADRTSTHTQMVGNRGFSLPPEMLAGDTAVGRYTDAWYLGSLLVWMLTGAPPDPSGHLPALPGPLASVAHGLCHRDPRQRMDLAVACQQLAAVPASPVVDPVVVASPTNPVGGSSATNPLAGPPGAGGYPPGTAAWSTTATIGTVPHPPYGTPPPAGSRPPSGPSDSPYAMTTHLVDQSDPAPSGLRAVAVLVMVGVLIAAVCAVALWLARPSSTPEAGPSANPPGNSRSTDPGPTETPEPEEPETDEPDYPPFEGLQAALAAVPLAGSPSCTARDAATFVPATAQEVFTCSWAGINATVYLTRWVSGAQGSAAWSNLTSDDLGTGVLVKDTGTWTLNANPDEPRGTSISISSTPNQPSTTTLCYIDLPYCVTIEYGDSYEYKKAESRLGLLNATEAATLVTSWHP